MLVKRRTVGLMLIVACSIAFVSCDDGDDGEKSSEVVPGKFGKTYMILQKNKLEFGKVQLRKSYELEFTIGNVSKESLKVEHMYVQEEGGKKEFEISTEKLVTLPSLKTLPIKVKFTPDAEGVRKAVLKVKTTHGVKDIPVTAEGTSAEVKPFYVSGDFKYPQAEVNSVGVKSMFSVVSQSNNSVKITDISIEGKNASEFVLAQDVLKKKELLKAEDKYPFVIVFKPSKVAKNITAKIRVKIDGAEDQLISISGDAVKKISGPKISVKQSVLSFGNVELGDSGMLVLEIKNIGDADLDISQLFIADNSVFSGLEFIMPSKRIIKPGESTPSKGDVFAVKFTPIVKGQVSKELTVISDAKNQPKLIVPITGTGK